MWGCFSSWEAKKQRNTKGPQPGPYSYNAEYHPFFHKKDYLSLRLPRLPWHKCSTLCGQSTQPTPHNQSCTCLLVVGWTENRHHLCTTAQRLDAPAPLCNMSHFAFQARLMAQNGFRVQILWCFLHNTTLHLLRTLHSQCHSAEEPEAATSSMHGIFPKETKPILHAL